MFVTWLLDSPKVKELITGRRIDRADLRDCGQKAVRMLRNSNSSPEPEAAIGDVGGPDFVAIEIPADMNSIEQADFDMARRWRETTRRAFSEALSEGFLVVDYFLKNEQTGFYLLTKTELNKA